MALVLLFHNVNLPFKTEKNTTTFCYLKFFSEGDINYK